MGFKRRWYIHKTNNHKKTTDSNKDNDIAPIKVTTSVGSSGVTHSGSGGTFGKKDEKERTWFQRGSLGDGFSGKNLTETVLGSNLDFKENLLTGVIGMGEKVVDAGAYLAGLLSFNDNYKKKVENFITKDLYDEEKIAKKIIQGDSSNMLTFDMLTGSSVEEASVFGEKSDSLVQSAGQLGATVGLQAVGVPWFVTTGTTTFGGEIENAFNQGAAYGEAGGSALISSGAEILSEKLSGGISFGGKTLDDALLKPLTEKISNKTIKALANVGIDAVGEGAEEIVSSVFSNLGTALYKEESIGELLASEEAMDEYLESFIGGTVLGGGISGVKTGIDAANQKPKLTENEQKVVEKETENRIAEQETDEKKLTKKEKKAIEEQVKKDLEKGRISIGTIESALGGENYSQYKSVIEQEESLQKEFNELNQMKQGEMTGEQLDRRIELKQQLEELKTNPNKIRLKEKISSEVRTMAQMDRLNESYNEKSRKSQKYEADLTKYDEKQQEVIKKAQESGILNNTNRTHEFVDMVAKISADKGVLFDFTNNAKLKESGFAVEGKTINGLVKDGNISLNIDSAKALNSIVGHEITHVLEGTDLHKELVQVAKDYAITKGEYQSRFEAIAKLYKDVDGAVVENEITADIVGEYLFTDSDFINNLSTKQPNIFKKIYDEIKYLYKIATAGSKEARQLEKVKRAFDKVYKESSKTSKNTKYSLADGKGKIYENAIMSDPHNIKPVNDITDKAKYEYLVKEFTENGYDGRPIVAVGDEWYAQAITGSHRIWASIEADIDVPVEFISLETEGATELLEASSDEERVSIAKELFENGDISKEVYELIVREDDLNYDNYNIPYSEQIRYSISKENQKKVGNYHVYGKDIALEIAPAQESVQEQPTLENAQEENTPINDTQLIQESEDLEEIAPLREDIERVLYSLEEEKKAELNQIDADVEAAETDMPELTVNENYDAKLKNYKNALDGYKTARTEVEVAFDEAIQKKIREYDALKQKNTKKAADILMQIENLRLRKANNLSNMDSRIERTESKVKNMVENADTVKQGMYSRKRNELHRGIMKNIFSLFKGKGFDFDEVLRKAEDKSTWVTVDNTPQRVMEKTLGYKEGKILADLTVNKVAQNETAGIKWVNENVKLLKEISKEYGIKPRSKESALAQIYAEGFYVNEQGTYVKYGYKELMADCTNEKMRENITKLAKDSRIRKIYDDTLDMINDSRIRNAYPEIQKRKNYFLHFTEMNDIFSRLGIPFNPNDMKTKDLPTDMNGRTADLKPGQPFFASSMHRKGYKTTYDLLGGVEKYLNNSKNQIFHIGDIQTLRALTNYIADTFGQAKGLEDLDSMTDAEAAERIDQVFNAHLSNFAKFLHEEANVIAGKTALIDRGLEGVIGRRGITFLNTLNRQVGSNMVGFNISSSLTNFISVMQSMAKTSKYDTLKAFTQTVSNKISSRFGRNDGFAEKNPAIIRRKGIEKIARKPFERVSDAGYVLMGAIDDISTEIIVRTKYNELTRKGMSEEQAHIESDKWAHRILGDRSLGQQPLLYNSKMLGLITKFQLEQRNQLDSMLYDTVQEANENTEHIKNERHRNAVKAAKVTSTLFQLAVLQHVFGKAFEAVAGYNPAFDIIEVLIKTLGFDDDEESEDTVLDNVEQGFLELMGDLPYTSTLTGGRIPISSALPLSELVTGQDSYGSEKPRQNTLLEMAPYYLLPTGYGQIKKTVQGLNMFSDENPVSGSYTDSGKLRFPVEDTIPNRLQAGIFGQYANQNAQYYFDNDIAPLKGEQIQEYIDVDIPIQDYWKYREGLSGLKTLNEKGDYIGSLDLPVEKKNILINNIADRKTPIDFTGYENYSNFQEFDFATRYPEKYAVLQELGISVKEYKEKYEESTFLYTDDYSWAADNPEKYTLSKAVTSDVRKYKQFIGELSEIKADKDANDKAIAGSRKEKVINYVNGLNIDYGAKLILFRSEYTSDDTYNHEIVEYLNSREDISYSEMVTILEELDFEVDADGTIRW